MPFALTLFLVIAAQVNAVTWRTGGPYGGTVSTVVDAPSNKEVLYAAAPSGV